MNRLRILSTGLVLAAICAVTGHALASPSLMVPATTLVGVGMAFLRANLREGATASAIDEVEVHMAGQIST